MISMERLKKQMEFALEADKEKYIFRQTHLSDGRAENDAEHAWHMALMIYLLKEYSDEKIDVARSMAMALIHDLVEIDAGDTYAYDEKGAIGKEERERNAAERIFGILPEEQKKEFMELFYEFEERVTPEARFARLMDNIQPLMLNDSHNGADWRSRGIKKSQVKKRQSGNELASKTLADYANMLIERNVEKGNLVDE